jgi:hypothetical protein
MQWLTADDSIIPYDLSDFRVHEREEQVPFPLVPQERKPQEGESQEGDSWTLPEWPEWDLKWGPKPLPRPIHRSPPFTVLPDSFDEFRPIVRPTRILWTNTVPEFAEEMRKARWGIVSPKDLENTGSNPPSGEGE